MLRHSSTPGECNPAPESVLTTGGTFLKEENISVGNVVSRAFSPTAARAYSLFVFVLKTFISYHFFGPGKAGTCEKMQQGMRPGGGHFHDWFGME